MMNLEWLERKDRERADRDLKRWAAYKAAETERIERQQVTHAETLKWFIHRVAETK